MDSIEKRNIMMENYRNPKNKGLINDNSYLQADMNNSSCIDEVKVMMKIENNIVKDVKFAGESCAICTSSASVMTELLKDKSIMEVKSILKNFTKMIKHEDYDESDLDKALAFDEIYKQPNRIVCALLPWQATEKIIKTLDKDA